MIVETTYTSREVKLQIDQALGPAYPLFERLKMGGNGSKRMVVKEVSEMYSEFFGSHQHANIELRPKGLLIHFKLKLESYAWLMPFKTLQIKTEKDLFLESDGKFIVFKDGSLINQSFLIKVKTALTA